MSYEEEHGEQERIFPTERRGLSRRDFCRFGMASAVALSSAAIPVAEAASPMADNVAYNGKIYTMNAKQPWAQAIAVTGGDIVYVGDDEGVKKFIGSRTTVADLKGKMVMPGIVSSHEHPFLSMGLASGLMLEYTEDASKMLAALKTYVTSNPDGAPFSFGGSYEGLVTITRQEIDAIVPDRPFLMIAASGHGGWCNTEALKLAGIAKGVPDPIDTFERDAEGVPTGYIESSAAIAWMSGVVNIITKEGVREEAEGVLNAFASNGITAVFDAGVPNMEDAVYPIIREMERQGTLPIRLSASVMTQRSSMTELVMEKLDRYSKKFVSEQFKVDTFKVHADGSFDGYTAGTLEPYTDRPETTGMTSFTPDVQREMTLAAAAQGYDIHTHTIGDRTLRQTLDAYEAVRKAGFDEVRLTTAHTCLVHPDDKPRFKELDVIVNTFATNNAVLAEGMLQRLGPERFLESGFQPMGSFVAMGVKVVMSADMPTAPLNPFLQMSIAMNRCVPGAKESLPPKSEALTLEQVIRAYTLDAAYMLRWENIIGSLEVGKRADLIILDKNLFELTTEEVADVRVLATIMNGKIVHEEAVDWGPSEQLLDDVDLLP